MCLATKTPEFVVAEPEAKPALPVPPDYVETIQETAYETAKEALELLNVPPDVIALVGDIFNLSYYLETCYSNPDAVDLKNPVRFEVEDIIIDTVGRIAKVGGVFFSPHGNTFPHDTSLIARLKAEAEAKADAAKAAGQS